MYRVKEFAKMVGKSPSTLRRWDSEGRLKPKRSVGNQRYYTDADLQKALNIETETQIGKTVVYALSIVEQPETRIRTSDYSNGRILSGSRRVR